MPVAGLLRIRKQPVLSLERISIAFNRHLVIDDVSLDIGWGETLVILGPAASGKTVLLKAAIGLLPVDKGRVCLFGQDITNRNEEELFPLRRRVGVVFQEGGLFDSLTVEENVAYPLRNRNAGRQLPEDEIGRRVREALEFVELEAAGKKCPAELSGGMQRRVAIARAVVANPDLVLYDSPTAGLDPITSFRIMTLIVRQRDESGAPGIVVTQRHQDGEILANFRFDPAAGKLARISTTAPGVRFLVIRQGRIVFEGHLEEFLRSRDPYVARFAGNKGPALESGITTRSLDIANPFLQWR
jgi:phospholipid/cholesterol/gamma-HCH transport system ATP-binding protein